MRKCVLRSIGVIAGEAAEFKTGYMKSNDWRSSHLPCTSRQIQGSAPSCMCECEGVIFFLSSSEIWIGLCDK